jgi:capsular polysaccharide export protein
MNRIGKIEGKNILLLQGPMGKFFKRLDRAFRKQGANTFRIGFNAGDRFFSYRDNYTPYRGKPGEEWKSFIEEFLERNRIEKIFLFGDCRHYQSIAIQVAMAQGVDVYVFEEGYIRPHYITMEKWGVNDYSHISRNPEFYRMLPEMEPAEPEHARQSKFEMIYSATLYYLLANFFHFRYPHYRHHRDMSAVREAFYGLRGLWRKGLYRITERGMEEQLNTCLDRQYYFVPLQTHNDFQILQHSDFKSIEKFIITVLESCFKHAPEETYLLFKHHPVDRGRKNYTKFIREQAELLGMAERVLVVFDTHLPTCLKHARATVTVNSTVGLTSIAYGVPTLTLGRAIYDIEGLTNRGVKLEEFWTSHKKPDAQLYKKFHDYIVETTQLNGSFYGMFPRELSSEEIYREAKESQPPR